MLTLVILALAVSGGLCVGTIAYTAYKSAELEKSMFDMRKSGFVHLL